MNVNNSNLSARVRRRNRFGFKGVGTEPAWSKKTPYGKIVKEKVFDRYENVKNFLRKHGHKHAGSKSAKQLRQYICELYK